MRWQWTDETRRVVVRTNADGSMDSRLASDAEVQAWIAAGNVPDDPPPTPARQPTPLDWFLRLSEATQAALDVAARTDTAVSLALRYASGVAVVDVSDPRTIANVALLHSKGLLTDDEQAALLAP